MEEVVYQYPITNQKKIFILIHQIFPRIHHENIVAIVFYQNFWQHLEVIEQNHRYELDRIIDHHLPHELHFHIRLIIPIDQMNQLLLLLHISINQTKIFIKGKIIIQQKFQISLILVQQDHLE